jgi:hypothetical protein
MKNNSIQEMAEHHSKKAHTHEQRQVAAHLARQMQEDTRTRHWQPVPKQPVNGVILVVLAGVVISLGGLIAIAVGVF